MFFMIEAKCMLHIFFLRLTIIVGLFCLYISTFVWHLERQATTETKQGMKGRLVFYQLI